jgi:hypothetical protein
MFNYLRVYSFLILSLLLYPSLVAGTQDRSWLRHFGIVFTTNSLDDSYHWSIVEIAAGLRQHSDAWDQSPRDPWSRHLFSRRHVRVSKWGLLFNKLRVTFYAGAAVLLRSLALVYPCCHRVQVTVEHCAPFLTALYYVTFVWYRGDSCLWRIYLNATTLYLQLVNRIVVGLAESKPRLC